MITYNPKDWFTFIFRLHKTETMIKLWPLLLGVGLYSAGWAYIETVLFKDYKSVAMASNIGIIYSILGFTLSLFLVFRTNTAYDRWWDGRKLWGERLRWEGRQEGRQEGRHQGQQEMLLDLVQVRFGALPEPVRQAILSADADRVALLGRRVLTATSVEALLLP